MQYLTPAEPDLRLTRRLVMEDGARSPESLELAYDRID